MEKKKKLLQSFYDLVHFFLTDSLFLARSLYSLTHSLTNSLGIVNNQNRTTNICVLDCRVFCIIVSVYHFFLAFFISSLFLARSFLLTVWVLESNCDCQCGCVVGVAVVDVLNKSIQFHSTSSYQNYDCVFLLSNHLKLNILTTHTHRHSLALLVQFFVSCFANRHTYY